MYRKRFILRLTQSSIIKDPINRSSTAELASSPLVALSLVVPPPRRYGSKQCARLRGSHGAAMDALLGPGFKRPRLPLERCASHDAPQKNTSLGSRALTRRTASRATARSPSASMSTWSMRTTGTAPPTSTKRRVPTSGTYARNKSSPTCSRRWPTRPRERLPPNKPRPQRLQRQPPRPRRSPRRRRPGGVCASNRREGRHPLAPRGSPRAVHQAPWLRPQPLFRLEKGKYTHIAVVLHSSTSPYTCIHCTLSLPQQATRLTA